MSTCNHAIGTAESDGYESVVYADSFPDISVWKFYPHSFCSKCGARITNEPSIYEALLVRVREEYANRPPSTDPFIRLMEADARKMVEQIDRQPSKISELLQKEPLPDGMGFNWKPK